MKFYSYWIFPSKSRWYFLGTASSIILIVTVSGTSFLWAQSNAEWQQIRQQCPGARAYLYYDDWVAHGAPCNGGGYSQPAPLSPEQIQQNQDIADARALNQKGLDALNSGDYDTALDYFQQALNKTPNDTNIQQNLQNAQDKIDARNKFNQDKQDAIHELKDSSGGDDTGDGLKDIGSSGDDMGLKDIGSDVDTNKPARHKKTGTPTPNPTPDNGVKYKIKWGDLPN